MPRQDVANAAILAIVAVIPDLDLLTPIHRGVSHSLGAAAIAGAVAFAVTRSPRWALAVGAAWASHLVLDWLSHDTWPPVGVMAFWPLTDAYYKAGLEVFPAVSRKYWLAEFWSYNLKAVAIELLLLGPIAGLTVWLRPRRHHEDHKKQRSQSFFWSW